MRKARIYDARQLPAYLSPAQYAELMGVTPKTVQRMCRTGLLPAEKVGPKLWRIDKNAALEQGALNRKTKSPPVQRTPASLQVIESDNAYHQKFNTKRRF